MLTDVGGLLVTLCRHDFGLTQEDMLTIILMMACGIVAGRLLRKRRLAWLSPLTTVLIWALLFLLGIEVGGDDRIIHSMSRLGAEGVAIALAASLGSASLAWGLWRWSRLSGKKGGAA
jgi:uncharacterized membrane protein YbjE (DUF340 family)